MQSVVTTVNIGGKDRELAFDFNAYAALEEQHNLHFLDLFNQISEAVRNGKMPRASDISLLVWAALYAMDESVTLRQVRSWITLANMNAILGKLMEPFGMARPANDLAPFLPTPPQVVDVAIRSLDLHPGDTLIDIGAGDGRVIEAALAVQPDIRAIAVEMNPERAALIRSKFGDRVRVWEVDANTISADELAQANKVFCYLLTESNERIRPLLESALKPGSRVVSHHFQFQGWPLAVCETIEVDGSTMSPHPVYTYIR